MQHAGVLLLGEKFIAGALTPHGYVHARADVGRDQLYDFSHPHFACSAGNFQDRRGTACPARVHGQIHLDFAQRDYLS